ncbi:MAG: dihydrofolate reductase, partial [Candidatus Nanopelagicaceae bacterium]
MSKIVAWTQWSDLTAPEGVTLRSPKDFPLDTSDLSEINFYVPSYMGGAAALSYAAKMPNLKTLQMP